MRNSHLAKFEEKLKQLEGKRLTSNNLASLTKETLLEMLNPLFETHRSSIADALAYVKFNNRRQIKDPKKTYTDINQKLKSLDMNTRKLLSSGMHNQGSFTDESLGAITARVLKKHPQREKLTRVVLETCSALKSAHLANGAKYIDSMTQVKYGDLKVRE